MEGESIDILIRELTLEHKAQVSEVLIFQYRVTHHYSPVYKADTPVSSTLVVLFFQIYFNETIELLPLIHAEQPAVELCGCGLNEVPQGILHKTA